MFNRGGFCNYLLYIVKPIVASILLLMASEGIWTGAEWAWDYWELRTMARQYAAVAQRMYYEENNPDVALTFLAKAMALQPDDPDFVFVKAYMEGMSATRNLFPPAISHRNTRCVDRAGKYFLEYAA